jgi:hypothetical protein
MEGLKSPLGVPKSFFERRDGRGWRRRGRSSFPGGFWPRQGAFRVTTKPAHLDLLCCWHWQLPGPRSPRAGARAAACVLSLRSRACQRCAPASGPREGGSITCQSAPRDPELQHQMKVRTRGVSESWGGPAAGLPVLIHSPCQWLIQALRLGRSRTFRDAGQCRKPMPEARYPNHHTTCSLRLGLHARGPSAKGACP